MSRVRISRESNKDPTTARLTQSKVVQDVRSIARACLCRPRTNHSPAAIHSREQGIALTTERRAERPMTYFSQAETAHATSRETHAQSTPHGCA